MVANAIKIKLIPVSRERVGGKPLALLKLSDFRFQPLLPPGTSWKSRSAPIPIPYRRHLESFGVDRSSWLSLLCYPWNYHCRTGNLCSFGNGDLHLKSGINDVDTKNEQGKSRRRCNIIHRAIVDDFVASTNHEM
jgi:hypothetical protein